MKSDIGTASGKIWEALSAKGEVEISRIPKLIGEKTIIAYQALGWLAREDKIKYRTHSSKVYVSLHHVL